MTEASKRGGISWIAFVGGAGAMLLIVFAWSAWRNRDTAAEALRDAASVVEAVPDVPKPTLPQAPRLPDAPIPQPK